MSVPLKILMLEDNATDAEIVQRILLKENLVDEFRLAVDKVSYQEALDQFQPDIILSDHSLPQFNSTNALSVARQKFPHIPIIMVTGAVSEEFAADIIKLGANDYILKDRLHRLPVAIDTALKQRKAETEKRETENRIIQSEVNLRTIFENTYEGFLLMDRNGIVKAFNSKAREYFFFSSKKELQTGQSIYDFIEEKRNLFFKEVISKVLTGESIQYDRTYEMENSKCRWIDFSITPVIEADKVTGICVTGRDITERKNTDESLKSMEQEMLKRKIQEQKKITRAINKAQEKERNHIGQELHDNVNQILVGTKLYLSMAGKDAKMKELVKYPMELIDKTISEIRLLSSKNVTPLKNINLKELLQLLLDNLDKSTTIKTAFIYEVTDKAIDDELKLNISRLIQEQLNNILKHTESQNVSVSVKADDHIINITVTDDGKGFDVKKKRKGIGISNMINRIESFNGEAEIISSFGKGCKIKIKIPY